MKNIFKRKFSKNHIPLIEESLVKDKNTTWFDLAIKYDICKEGSKTQRIKAANDIFRKFLRICKQFDLDTTESILFLKKQKQFFFLPKNSNEKESSEYIKIINYFEKRKFDECDKSEPIEGLSQDVILNIQNLPFTTNLDKCNLHFNLVTQEIAKKKVLSVKIILSSNFIVEKLDIVQKILICESILKFISNLLLHTKVTVLIDDYPSEILNILRVVFTKIKDLEIINYSGDFNIFKITDKSYFAISKKMDYPNTNNIEQVYIDNYKHSVKYNFNHSNNPKISFLNSPNNSLEEKIYLKSFIRCKNN